VPRKPARHTANFKGPCLCGGGVVVGAPWWSREQVRAGLIEDSSQDANIAASDPPCEKPTTPSIGPSVVM
jgi:hypothetical protein